MGADDDTVVGETPASRGPEETPARLGPYVIENELARGGRRDPKPSSAYHLGLRVAR